VVTNARLDDVPFFLALARHRRLLTAARRLKVADALRIEATAAEAFGALSVDALAPAGTVRLLTTEAFELCEPAELDATVRDLLDVLLGHAPLTMWATKATLQRLRLAALPDDDDIIAAVFGSDDFHVGVDAFVTKQRAQWTGQ
jgi:enoyl-CoA hydratase/carnithine racemase